MYICRSSREKGEQERERRRRERVRVRERETEKQRGRENERKKERGERRYLRRAEQRESGSGLSVYDVSIVTISL